MRVKLIASRYRVVRELGRGGMGAVYVVEHVNTGERLALKLLHGAAAENPDVIARFKREARVGAQIKSEHVVRVTDADVAPELGGAPFFVMELLEGLDLEKAIEAVGRFHPAAVIAVLSQVAKALDKAHAIGIVHRDLKPENIFLHRRDDGSPMAKVLDFGISKFVSAGNKSGIGTTATGTLMGPPAYMAPEQARGDVEQMGPATDIWAVGLIALRLLTAASYWTADSQAELMVQILVMPLPRPSERWSWLGARFDEWFARSCNRDPVRRWTSVSEQVAALAAVLAELPIVDGASMESLAGALHRVGVPHATVPSGEVDFPDVRNVAPDALVRAPRQHYVTTGGPESMTVKPSLGGRRSGPRIFWSFAAAATIGLAAFAARTLFVQRVSRPESASSAAITGPTGSVAPQESYRRGGDIVLTIAVDGGTDPRLTQAPSAGSVEPARGAVLQSQQHPSSGTRQSPRTTKPRPTRADDPMAP